MQSLVSQIVVTDSTWEDTYERSFAQVFCGLVALGARPDEAEDALHHAFAEGLEGGGDISSPASWLFAVASRRWRRQRWRERALRPLVRQKDPAVADASSGVEPFDALRRLPRRQREVLVARYIVKLSQDETARALGIASDTVAATGMEAARELRSLMEPAMNDEFERWAVRAFEDAAPRIPLPRQDRWIPDKRTHGGEKLGAMLALAAVATLLVAVAAVYADAARTGAGDQKTPPSTATPIRDLTRLPESAQWGGVWSVSSGAAVLRPGWLPRREDEYQVSFSVDASSSRLMEYAVSYVERRPTVGTTVWAIDFVANPRVANPLEDRPRRFLYLGDAPKTERVTVRGHAAELTGAGSPVWQLAWSEGGYWYGIQGFAISREDLLRVADSLAPVIDDTGRTGS